MTHSLGINPLVLAPDYIDGSNEIGLASGGAGLRGYQFKAGTMVADSSGTNGLENTAILLGAGVGHDQHHDEHGQSTGPISHGAVDDANWVLEQESLGASHSNDTPQSAQHLVNLGTNPGNVNEVSLLGSLGVTAREIQVHEDDGAIQFASETGLVAGQTDAIIARGQIGNGPHGSGGTGFGDYDYFKISATVGQLISVNVEGESLDSPYGSTTSSIFDPVVAIVSSAGEVLTYNDNNNYFALLNFYNGVYNPLKALNDSSLRYLVPGDGDYYVVVFSSLGFQSSPFDSSSGAGVYSEGDYQLSITTESPQILVSKEFAGVEDGAIDFANETGVEAGVDAFVYATGYIGDGLYGQSGAATGDFDMFRFAAVAGQRIILSADTDPRLSSVFGVDAEGYIVALGMDSKVIVYDSAGAPFVFGEDHQNFDGALDFTAPYTGTYYVSVSGFSGGRINPLSDDYFPKNFLANSFDPASGGGAGTEGFYNLFIKTERVPDRDAYSLDLRPGDIISVAALGGLASIQLLDPNGQQLHLAYTKEDYIRVEGSPLLAGIGDAGFNRVITAAGRYTILLTEASVQPFDPNFAFSTPASPYNLIVRVNRSGIESQPVYTHQVLYLDFDGVPSTALLENGFYASTDYSPTVENLSGMAAYLPQYGLSTADEDSMIDFILPYVADRLSVSENGAVERAENGAWLVFDNAGQIQLEILNSRDHQDYYGIYPNVSRVIVGTSTFEFNPTDGGGFIGIANSIDTGNYDQGDQALVLVDDTFSLIELGLASGSLFLAPTASRTSMFAQMLAAVIAHEAAHNLGAWHNDPLDNFPELMDSGPAGLDAAFRNILGVGPDQIYGSDDDVALRLTSNSVFSSYEFPYGSVNDTLNTVAYGLSTGTKSGTYFDFVTGTLYVSGNIDDGRKDELEVKNSGSNIKVYVNDVLILTRPAAGVSRVVLNGSSDRDELDASHYSGPVTLFGRGGKDELKGGSNDDLLFGGDGDDELKGNAGNDVLVGGGGDDDLDGGPGADVLIGGLGADELDGGGGGELLIAGSTAFDANSAALHAIVKEWSSGRSYATRVANLRGTGSGPRDNATFYLKTTGPQATVFTDSSSDKLSGNSGRDWFFAKLSGNKKDKIHGLGNDEFVDALSF